MRIDIKPVQRLRGAKPLDVSATLAPVIEALRGSEVDLSRVHVVCDWVQYRHNFRRAVDVRPTLGGETRGEVEGLELAVDLRQAATIDVEATVREALATTGVEVTGAKVFLEGWTRGARSRIWEFNELYWRALNLWEAATGQGYEQALPGGESDANNRDAAAGIISTLFEIWDQLSDRNALPPELYVVEIGVGNGNQARAWLDQFVEMDKAHGREYYRRLHYIMGDYSPHVLRRAEENVSAHAAHVSGLVLDATRPTSSLGFLRYKAFLVYISNVYDNLPTDEVAHIDGRNYSVEVRAYLGAEDVANIAAEHNLPEAEVGAAVDRLLRLGPELLTEVLSGSFPDVDSAVRFWRDVWEAVKLDERFVPLDGLDLYEISPTVGGEVLSVFLEGSADRRMHVNNGAVASFVDTIQLLHPYGLLQSWDIFVKDVHQYDTGFHGPGKYDGSVVNWVNGPLLAYVGSRRGVDVSIEPFRHRQGANVTTLTAQVKE